MNSQCVKSWKYSILFALFFLVNYAFSQKTISTQHQVWSQLFYTIKIKGKWSISGDALYRWNAENGRTTQAGARNAVVYTLKPGFSVGLGYTFFMHYSGQNDAILSRMEHRPFQQLILQNQYGRLQVQHRYRLEQRFIESVVSNEYTGSFEGNFRLRYQLNLQYRLSKKKEGQGVLLAVVADELMVNFGKKIVNNYFDQNRVRVGFSYQLFKNLSIGLDYQHIWQQRQRAASFFNTNCIRATFNYTLDLQKNVK